MQHVRYVRLQKYNTLITNQDGNRSRVQSDTMIYLPQSVRMSSMNGILVHAVFALFLESFDMHLTSR